jgi:hypothetical protein
LTGTGRAAIMKPVGPVWGVARAQHWAALLLPLAAGCAGPEFDSQVQALTTDAGARAAAATLVDDSAAEFAAGQGVVTDKAVVEQRGVVAPLAHFYGGLLAHAAEGVGFTSAATATFADATAVVGTGQRGVARSLTFATAAPLPGVGLASVQYTAIFEGEVFLEAGTWTFFIRGEDHVFVELAGIGTTFARVASADSPSDGSGLFEAPADSWYPIRIAVAHVDGAAAMTVDHDGPGVPGRTAVSRQRLRFVANDLPGLITTGFDEAMMVGEAFTTIDATTPASQNWGLAAPPDLGIVDPDLFSIRVAGQMHVAVDGGYVFRLITDDGQRLWIDGNLVLDAWDFTIHNQTTPALFLEAGWHDLVVDQVEDGGDARLSLAIETSPDGSTGALSVENTRPVVGTGERYGAGHNPDDIAIPDLATVDRAVDIDAPSTGLVTGIELYYQYTHTFPRDIRVDVIAPDGTEATVVVRSVNELVKRVFSTAFNGVAAGGQWRVRFVDELSGDSGTILDVKLTVHYSGGPAPIATAAAFESGVRDLGGAAVVTKLSWVELAPGASDVQLRLRSGTSAADCLAAPWSEPFTDPAGTAPMSLSVSRFMQYRIEFTSNGAAAPEVDAVQIDVLIENAADGGSFKTGSGELTTLYSCALAVPGGQRSGTGAIPWLALLVVAIRRRR